MSVVPSVIVLILVLLILMVLQLIPGTFAIFYHSALGKNSSKKADNLSLWFTLGVEFFATAVWLICYFVLFVIFYNVGQVQESLLWWILAGIVAVESVLVILVYYRKKMPKNSTALIVPRRYVRKTQAEIRMVKNQREAVAVGFFAGVPELIFSLPLFVVANVVLLYTTNIVRAIVIILGILAMVLPLFVIRFMFRAGQNLVDIQKMRVKMKPVLMVVIPCGYLAVAGILMWMGAK